MPIMDSPALRAKEGRVDSVSYPILFEAVLGAEEALEALFLACWTLELAGVVVTVCAQTCLRLGFFLHVHGVW